VSALRDLVARATPGPWEVLSPNILWFWSTKEHRDLPLERFQAQSELIALTPELAVWATDARDALDMCHTGMGNIVCSRGGIGCSVDHDYLAPLLARFDKLEQEGAA
jgi:hypothetical protein